MREFFRLSDDWGRLAFNSKLVLYGMGRIGRRVLPTLMREFEIPFLADNGQGGTEIMGLSVLGLSGVVERIKREPVKIVVTTVMASYREIARELMEAGLREYEDFCYFERFAGEWNLRWQNRCVLSKIDTVITSRCTLKCQHCNLFVSHAASPQDIPLESLKQNFDVFFDSVDFVYEYTLLGGEPFLHKDFAEILSYLGGVYGDRIGRINLISNGTVLPSEDVMRLMDRFHVIVHISDYTKSVPYGERLEKVRELFSRHGILYYVIPNNTWKDVVYPHTGYHTDDPMKHMQLCGHSTHSVGNGRLYWCDPAFAAECFIGFPSKPDDFLELEKNRKNHSKYEASVNILRYLLGDVNKRGYMSICERCAGIGKDNENIVIAGVQMQK